VHLEPGDSRSGGLTPYQVEDLVDALERMRQAVVDGEDTASGAP